MGRKDAFLITGIKLVLEIKIALTPQEAAYLINLIGSRPINEAALLHNKLYSAAKAQTLEHEKNNGQHNAS